MLQVFTTRTPNRQERSRQWRAITHAERVEFEDDRQASLRGGPFGPVLLCRVSMGRHRVVQTERAARAPSLKFLFQEEGSAMVHQAGRCTRLRPGQWCAVRKDVPFEFDAPQFSRQLAITIPCEILAGPCRGTDWWRQSRSFQTGAAQILHATAAASLLSAAGLSAESRDLLGRQMAALAGMVVRAEAAAAHADPRHDRRKAVLDYIDENLADPELSVCSVAAAFGLAKRTLHKMFEGEAFTVARLIWDRRLERCRDAITDPAVGQSITEVAHLWGFSDSQHFSRAFKQRFGMSPREYRQLFAVH